MKLLNWRRKGHSILVDWTHTQITQHLKSGYQSHISAVICFLLVCYSGRAVTLEWAEQIVFDTHRIDRRLCLSHWKCVNSVGVVSGQNRDTFEHYCMETAAMSWIRFIIIKRSVNGDIHRQVGDWIQVLWLHTVLKYSTTISECL